MIGRPRGDSVKAFWSHVDKTSHPGGCWVWTGSCNRGGYGQMKFNRKQRVVHRVSFELAYGFLPADMFVCHHCDNKRCIRPDHLFLGTPRDNVMDSVAKGRRCVGERHRTAKLRNHEVIEIRRRYHEDRTPCCLLALEYPVNAQTISKIVHGQLWKHLLEVAA